MTKDRVQRARPHRREFFAQDMTPLAAYRRLERGASHAFLLESVTGGEQVSRFSFLGSSPAEVCRLYADRLEVERDGAVAVTTEAPLEALRRRLGAVRTEPDELPFEGGWVGWFGYDLVRSIERLGTPPADPYGLPVVQLARYDTMLVYDHARQRLTAIANEVDGEVDRASADRALDEICDRILAEHREPLASRVPTSSATGPPPARPLVSADRFAEDVRRAQELIRAGDVLQVVLARRWEAKAEVAAHSLYRALRLINPSPYMVLLEFPELALVGASPEMLVRQVGERVETRPIAGTRPRGTDAEHDEALARELLADEKERAEHVMLVDLGRNDLGRIARPGSVEVRTFMEVERYSHVMHLVSSVVGRARPDAGPFETLLACFPAGTVSGAPKVRAMQIIDELESEGRGPYAGAVGYLSFSGDLDACITIRTLVARDGAVSVTAGAGIVADSVPEREAEETENKAAAMLAAVELARALEESA